MFVSEPISSSKSERERVAVPEIDADSFFVKTFEDFALLRWSKMSKMDEEHGREGGVEGGREVSTLSHIQPLSGLMKY